MDRRSVWVAAFRSLDAADGRPVPSPSSIANSGPLPLFWPGLVARNLFFLLIVLLHAFRRLLPTY